MKIFLSDQEKVFGTLLSELILLPVADTTGVALRAQISTVQVLSGRDFNEIDYNILFEYRIFPPTIMSYMTQWSVEQRRMRVGDTILQEVFVPPFRPAFRILFGVRIDSVIDTPGRRGFSYQTLEGHAEKGRSVFTFETIGSK